MYHLNIFSGSKENLMSSKEACQQRIEMMHKQNVIKFPPDLGNQNVSYKRETDISLINNELNHNTVRSFPAKRNSSDLNATSNQNQTWADRLPRNGNNNNELTISASKLRLLHDTTMIDTALDLDSLDGSTVSLWPATV